MSNIDPRTQAFRDWIAAIQKKLGGITITELARRAEVSHSTLSRATGDDNYRINFRADTISKIVEVGGLHPPASLLVPGAQVLPFGMNEADAAPWDGAPERHTVEGQSIWTVHSSALSPVGLMPGDRFILDGSLKPKQRDIIMVQNYDHQSASAESLLRIFADGFAVLPLYLVDNSPRIWIDGQNAVVMGVVTESWRTRAA